MTTPAAPSPPEFRRTFVDPSGRRRRLLRRFAVALGVVTTGLFIYVLIGLVVPPMLPRLPLRQTAGDSLGYVPRTGRVTPRRPISVRAERERLAARQRLFAFLRDHPSQPSQHYREMPIQPSRHGVHAPSDPIVAGFYVNWDDNSLASLRQHIGQLDWVVAEWGFLADFNRRDTLPLRINVDRRVLAMAAAAREPPAVLLMLTNATSSGFEAAPVTRLLRSPPARRRAIRQLADTVARYGALSGVTIDFEEIPRSDDSLLIAFIRQLRKALGPGRLIAQAIPGDSPAWPLEAYAAVDDRVFVMLYDEHDPSDDPGPIASQAWFERNLARAVRRIPPAKVLVGIGQYGYVWSDTAESATELTFQDVMQLARDHALSLRMDRGSMNPYAEWVDPDSIAYAVWYLDGPTAYNEMRRALPTGVGGLGIWRLGAEDPSLWSVLNRHGVAADPAPLDTMRISYDVDFVGSGEILRMMTEPTLGQRSIAVDDTTGLVVGERVLQLPSTWVIRRYGRRKHAIALTFDDGPDGKYTPKILDTLRSRGVKATFFVIGENAEIHPELLRRELREGDEIGNHSFTHPNMALVGRRATELELTATERLIEAVTGRRTALWRPPYFGDAEPTTADELDPIAAAQRLGYITVGLRVDPGDWETPGVDSIITRTLNQLDRGNVVLLHDGGGDRSQTVRALGPLIDSLRARGYELTTVTALAGIPASIAMQPLPPGSRLRRFLELTSYSLVGWITLAMHAVFMVAMALGALRLVTVIGLALRHRFGARPAGPSYQPTVSVIVPAYNEEPVVVRTVQSLLDQHYPGLEVVVVDDGSPDHTSDVVRQAFGGNPVVRLFRKSNGGKASALNYGVTHATGEIIVGVDADTLFPPGTIAALVQPLADPRVGAVAGNAKVGNRINLVTRWQAIEYITSQNLDRRAFALLNTIMVVPGAIGAWRRDRILEAGGFSDETLAEDQDLTITLLERGAHVAYAEHAAAYTEAPDTLRTLARQRFRWSYGTLQCAWKHRYAFLNPRYGELGLVGLPNVWIFQILFPLIAPVADLLFLWSLATVYLNEIQHGPEFAQQTFEQVVLFYTIFLTIDWLAAMIALWMEPGEDRSLGWLVLLQRFAYRQVIYWVVVQAVVAALEGRARGWGKQQRKGTVALGGARP